MRYGIIVREWRKVWIKKFSSLFLINKFLSNLFCLLFSFISEVLFVEDAIFFSSTTYGSEAILNVHDEVGKVGIFGWIPRIPHSGRRIICSTTYSLMHSLRIINHDVSSHNILTSIRMDHSFYIFGVMSFKTIHSIFAIVDEVANTVLSIYNIHVFYNIYLLHILEKSFIFSDFIVCKHIFD